ncbi:MAG: trigger factor [Patescibacteria group bacterium]|nr:trigger factor [Patescibacteria group bacterium]MDD5121232.1 trigger factor [Patescibacteria group bacterium]MDD5222215.1 trigger factor [Patescibacteria group bacterium]MDD5395849.1 trigger factor [Patescibacteria group bacterium]
MNYTTKKLPKNLLEIEVTLTADELKEFYQQALSELGTTITVSGFRPGKAPLDLVERQAGQKKVLEQATELAINKSYRDIILKEKIWPIGEPKVDLVKLALDNPFIFKITLVLMPKVKLGDYKKIKTEAKPIKIDEKQVDRFLKELQQMRRKEALVKRPAQLGDRAEIDLEMFLDKVPLENGSAKNMSVVLGEDFYIPGLSNQLIGLEIEKTKEFNLQYPAEHFDKKLAGKQIDFKVKLNNLYQIDLPELNDDFAKGVGKFKDLVGLKDQLRKNLEDEAKRKEEQRQELEILKQLIDKSQFEEIPEVLVESELDRIIGELQATIEGQGLKFDDYLTHLKKTLPDLRREFISKAEDRVKTSLAIREVAEQEKIVISDKELDDEVEKMAANYAQEPDLVEHIKSARGRDYLYNIILNRRVIEFLRK